LSGLEAQFQNMINGNEITFRGGDENMIMRVMKDSFQPDTRFKLILTVSPAESYLPSSLKTISFGHRMFGIKTNQNANKVKILTFKNFIYNFKKAISIEHHEC